MMKMMKGFCLVSFLVLIITPAAMASKVLPGPLVNSEWLDANISKVIVLDVAKSSASYDTEGHIPGAVFVSWGDVRAKRNVDGVDLIKLIPLADDFAALMRSAGVDQDSSVVVSCEGDTYDAVTFATRLLWTLKYFGLDDVALLDGGNAQWVAEGYALTTEASSVVEGNFVAVKEEADMYATTAEVVNGITDFNSQLLDGRELSYYLGVKMKSYVYNPGHVPSAKNLPYELLFSAEPPYTFADVDDVAQAMTATGLDLDGAFITICNSGHKASGQWFVIHELMGNKRTELYDGSMHEWTMDTSLPVSIEME
ncbi:MAG: rhodanese-like domain-containing protein [Desulfuromonadales bacterium]|nr:rhodanese-like domain-containing protein [Desulfuromonadales bacterium]